MSYQVLARKWRPRNFAEMVGQEHVLRALINALDSQRLHHAFLFTGTRGVGKTTLARILAKSLNCEKGVSSMPCGECATCQEIDQGRFVDLIEVDAASRTKVEDTRDLLDNVQYAPTRGRYKVYLIDEVHMLSNHSFNALLKTLEEPPEHVKFLLATTDPQKLPVTILSRCLQFNLRRLSPELIEEYLQSLLEKEGVIYDASALHQLARAADGSMRDALSLLDQAIAFGAGQVSDDDVRSMLGSIEHDQIYEILHALIEQDGPALLEQVALISDYISDLSQVLPALLTVLHHVALLKQIPGAYDETMGNQQALMHLVEKMSPETIQLYYQIALIGRRDLSLAPDPRIGLEMVLLRMLAFKLDDGNVSVSTGKPATMQSQVKPVTSTVTATSAPDTAPQAINSKKTNTVSQPVSQVKAEPIISHVDTGNWYNVVKTLPLAGLVKQMAMQSVLLSFENGVIQLGLARNSEAMLTKERQAQLEKALAASLGQQVKLDIQLMDLDDVQQETPAQQEQRDKEARHAAAQQAIADDPNVQNLLDTFDGQINTQSVQPIDETIDEASS